MTLGSAGVALPLCIIAPIACAGGFLGYNMRQIAVDIGAFLARLPFLGQFHLRQDSSMFDCEGAVDRG